MIHSYFTPSAQSLPSQHYSTLLFKKKAESEVSPRFATLRNRAVAARLWCRGQEEDLNRVQAIGFSILLMDHESHKGGNRSGKTYFITQRYKIGQAFENKKASQKCSDLQRQEGVRFVTCSKVLRAPICVAVRDEMCSKTCSHSKI